MSLRAADEWHVSAGVGQVLVPAAAGECAAQVEILAMGLLEGGAEGLDLLPMLSLELVDLCGAGSCRPGRAPVPAYAPGSRSRP